MGYLYTAIEELRYALIDVPRLEVCICVATTVVLSAIPNGLIHTNIVSYICIDKIQNTKTKNLKLKKKTKFNCPKPT